MSGCITIIVWVFFQIIGASLVWAGPIKTLVMSGKLIEGHAKYEESCNKCHQPFNDDSQNILCLKCHKDIAEDMKSIRGFHGRVKTIKERECQHCHTDHKGRTADIIMLDEEMFDHSMTDFAIGGGHARVDCIRCHPEGKKYRETPSDCGGCHLNKDPHRGNLGDKCEECHSEASWNKTEFDHGKSSFPLRGEHEKLSCAFCHTDKRFNEKVSNSCYSCHVVNDIHNGSFGRECRLCHREVSWREVHFTHEKVNFPLTGRHSKVECSTCHRGRSYKEKIGTSCFSCHRYDDEHNGSFGQTCDRCHSVKSGWPDYSFDHDKTTLPLLGLHKKVTCDSCHRLPLKPGWDSACYDCHKRGDVHSGAYGERCNLCHTLKKSWPEAFFDHDSIDFPLRGEHKKLNCSACHKRIPGEDKKRTRCIDCHITDDIHKNQEGKICERCHNEEGWNTKLLFDHDLTPFPLIGLHAVTPCEDCHLDSAFKKTSQTCIECHNSSDAHKNRLGEACNQCHTPNGWRLWTFSHTTSTEFKLNGKHKRIKCVLCHKDTPEKSLKVSPICIDCHGEDDRHRGAFGRVCKRCHTTNSFKELSILQ